VDARALVHTEKDDPRVSYFAHGDFKSRIEAPRADYVINFADCHGAMSVTSGSTSG
jgi:hypothetical protein